MLTIKQLQAEKSSIESIKLIADTLAEIATSKVKRTKKDVQQNISYFKDITKVYKAVKGIAQVSNLYQTNEFKKNGQLVMVVLTSNEKFHGGVDSNLVDFFISISNTLQTTSNSQYIMVGASGKNYLESFSSTSKKFQYIHFQKDLPTLQELKSLASLVFQFSKIMVFHTKFVTLLSQTPTITDLSLNIEAVSPKNITQFILEPELAKMIKFFETQLLMALFNAVFLETNLAREAARMISMHNAGEAAADILDDDKKKILRFKKEIINLRLLETYSARIKKVDLG